MKSDIEPPKPDPPTPTLDGLATEIKALRRRVALLEIRSGVVSGDTMTDLPDEDALAVIGGDLYRLEEMREEAKRQRGAH